MTKSRTPRTLFAVTALALLAGACGSDDDSAETTAAAVTTAAPTTAAAAPTTAASASSTPAGATVAVTAADYKFEGIPATLAAGSKLTLTNASAKEFHELVAFHLPDTEKRTVPELLALSEEELNGIVGQGPPAAVLLAPPSGAPQIAAVGDGTLAEPGRYVFICAIPVGADPQVVADAMKASGQEPPELGDGPPHFTAGMWAETVVG